MSVDIVRRHRDRWLVRAINGQAALEAQTNRRFPDGAFRIAAERAAKAGSEDEAFEAMVKTFEELEVAQRFPWAGGRTLRSVLRGN